MITRRDALKTFACASLSTVFGTAFSAQGEQTQAAAATLAKFLDGAEIQAENQIQRHQIAQALKEMATESPAVLRDRRYADYQGNPGKWTLLELLKHHIVPRENVHLTANILFEALATEEGKAAVRGKLTEYERHLRKAQVK